MCSYPTCTLSADLTAVLFRQLLSDVVRTKRQLIAENALLRQQLIVLNRSVKRPRLTDIDRSLLVLLASRVHAWKDALLIVQPTTLLRWHRQGFRLFWRRKSRAGARAPRVPVETIALIKEMAVTNRFTQWVPGREAQTGRGAEAGHQGSSADHPALHAPSTPAAT